MTLLQEKNVQYTIVTNAVLHLATPKPVLDTHFSENVCCICKMETVFFESGEVVLDIVSQRLQ